METGTVKWFSDTKGRGVIERDTSVVDPKDVTVFYDRIKRPADQTLSEKERVQFEIIIEGRDMKTIDVEPL